MRNEEKYNTPKERICAFNKFCNQYNTCKDCHLFMIIRPVGRDVCAFKWLELEAKNESPEPCPFCGKETKVIHISYDNCFAVKCYKGCGYISAHTCSENGAVANHNKLCHKLKEGESK